MPRVSSLGIFFLWVFVCSLMVCAPQSIAADTSDSLLQYQYSGDKLPKALLALNSPPAKAWLQGQSMQPFLGLISYFVTEKGLAYCGIASSVMVLNDLNIATPLTPRHAPYKIFNQDNFFSQQRILRIITPAKVSYEGVTLGQLVKALRVYAPHTYGYYAGKVKLRQFRQAAIEAVNSKSEDIIVNFCRKDIHERGCGHFSPLAAYNAKEDRFLLLDVARYKYPPVWVKAAELYVAMDTVDSSSKQTRGYIIVKN